jgi:Ca2+-binding EF-hand superfamily protein
MIRLLCLNAAAVGMLAAADFAPAQQEKPKRPDAAALFSQLDKNGDGFITEDEVGDDRKAFFERLLRVADKNKDGKLSKDEFVAGLAAGEAKRPEGTPGEKRPLGKDFDPEAMFNRLDKNGDGKITKDEIPEERAEFLRRMDTDGDGVITKEEFKAGIAKLRSATGGAPAGGRPSVDDVLFRALDTNGDGKLSAEEISRAAESLKKLDRNGDGMITRDELVAAAGTAGGGTAGSGLPERLKQFDKDGDGKLSRDEAPERLKENFDRFDLNKDGFLDADELRKAFEGFKTKAKKEPPKPKE